MLPFLKKRADYKLKFNLDHNNPIFQYLFFEKYKEEDYNHSLILCIHYISNYTGEQYYFYQEFNKNNFFSNNEFNDFSRFSLRKIWLIPLNDYQPILSDFPNSCLNVPDKNFPYRQCIRTKFFDNASDDAFAMVLIEKPLGADWTFFFDNHCIFEFNIKSSSVFSLKLEIKNGLKQHILNPSDKNYIMNIEPGWVRKQFPIRELNPDRSSWKNILELCFIVFKQGNPKIEDIVYHISNVRIRY